MGESKKVADLSDKELLENFEDIDVRIDAEYRILSVLKASRNEHLQEIYKIRHNEYRSYSSGIISIVEKRII